MVRAFRPKKGYGDQFIMSNGREIFIQGAKDGVPIGLGYFAVSVSLGITASSLGFNAVQGFLASLLTYASAGEYMGFSLYTANTTLAELIILTFIINARYLLMGFALNQRMPEGTPLLSRVLVGTCITDEIFGVTIARDGAPTPYYTFGAAAVAVPLWAAGTSVGISMGSILPASVVSALSVALFGMFIAVIIPPGRKDHAVLGAVILSFACSYASLHIPVISSMSTGNRTIILTVLLCSIFALLFPRTNDIGADGSSAAEDLKGGESCED